MEYDGTLKSNICYLDFYKNSATSNKQKNVSNLLESKISDLLPSVPVYATRLMSVQKATKWFLNNFSGKILYSVKSNPEEIVLKEIYKAGVRNFDVASLSEIALVSKLFPDCLMYFMHPIKSRESIFQAYFNFGIRNFSLDSLDELDKILETTKNKNGLAKDLSLHIRLAIPNSHAAIDLSGKFGILPSESIALIRKARVLAKTLGICFHVGSQCMEPSEYRNAIQIVKEVLEHAKVKLDVLDVGGGFPSSYPGLTPPPLKNYINEINDAVKSLPINKSCQVWCEPGRALVAESGSLVVRVEARKNQMLYINDGTYGGLFDAGYPGFIYHTKTISLSNKNLSNNLLPFGFYGPTCDSLDTMKGPFYLPENIAEGDYIEIGGLGAYSKSIRTAFNGFDKILQIEIADQPIVSMYEEDQNLKTQSIK